MTETAATQTETNRAIIRQAFDAWTQGTSPITDVFAPEMTWEIVGHSVIWDGHGVANDGQPYENSYAWIMRLADGMVVDGVAFYDSISFNGLWSRVQPR